MLEPTEEPTGNRLRNRFGICSLFGDYGTLQLPSFRSSHLLDRPNARGTSPPTHGARQKRLRCLGTWLETRPTWPGAPPPCAERSRDATDRSKTCSQQGCHSFPHELPQRGRHRPEPGGLCIVSSWKKGADALQNPTVTSVVSPCGGSADAVLDPGLRGRETASSPDLQCF